LAIHESLQLLGFVISRAQIQYACPIIGSGIFNNRKMSCLMFRVLTIAFASLVLFSASPSFAAQSAYTGLITTHAKANGIPVVLAHAVVRHESGFNARATGRAGEV